MTIGDLMRYLPEGKFDYEICAVAYNNDNMEPGPIEGIYLDDKNKQLVIEW